MKIGFIKLHRKAVESDLWKDATAWRIFEWCLLNCDWKTGIVTVGRFQISRETGINPNTVKSASHRLVVSHRCITIKSTNKFSTIKLLNWSKYQGQENESPPASSISHQQNTNKTPLLKNIRSKEIKEVGATEKISNNLSLSKIQTMALAKEFPDLSTDEIEIQRQKCNSYMNMSSNNYINPGLFFKGWLKKYHTELKTKELVAAETKRILNAAPEISEEQRLKNLTKLAEMRKNFKIGGIN